MRIRRVFRWIIFFVGLYAVSMTVWGPQAAHAAGPEKPSILTMSSGDVSQADSAVTKIVNFILYFVYAGGTIALVISLAMCLPYVGKTQQGMTGIKASIIVMLCAGGIQIFFSFIGKLFT